MPLKRVTSGRTEGDSTMNAEGVIQVLDEHREELRRLGVRRLGLYEPVPSTTWRSRSHVALAVG
jgi:hypothetical protein